MKAEVEDRMWDIMKQQSHNDDRLVRISYYAVNQLPIHKQQATQLVKNWDNRGLVISTSNGARARLTQKGKRQKAPPSR